MLAFSDSSLFTMNATQESTQSTPFPPTPIITLQRVVIRPYHANDLESMCHHADNPKIAQWMRNTFPSPYTLEAGKRWLDMKLDPSKMQTDFLIAIDGGKTCIGSIGVKPDSDVLERYMEVGYWIGEEFWGQGLATEVLSAFVRWAFREYQYVEKFGGTVFGGNVASERVLKKVGFVQEGILRKHIWKNGQFKDLVVFGLLREDCEREGDSSVM